MVDEFAARASSDADLARMLVGFNNFLKMQYVNPHTAIALHGNQDNALAAMRASPELSFAAIQGTPEYRMGYELNQSIAVRLTQADVFDADYPYDTASGVLHSDRLDSVNEMRTALRENFGEIIARAPAMIDDVPLTPGLIIRIAMSSELLRQAGFVGDVVDLASTLSAAQQMIADGQVADAERLIANFSGSLIGGAGGAIAATAFAGLMLAGTGVGAVPGGLIMLFAGIAGGIAGGAVGELVADSLYDYMASRSPGDPIILDDIISAYHAALQGAGAFEKVLLGVALTPLVENGGWTPQTLAAKIAEVVRANPEIDVGSYQFNQALLATLPKNALGGVSPSLLAEVYREVQSQLDGQCFPGNTKIALWDGTSKPIADVRIGDQVLSYDADGKQVPGEVTKLYRGDTQEWVELQFDLAGETRVVTVTPGHPFLTATGTFAPIASLIGADGIAEIVAASGETLRAKARLVHWSAETAPAYEAAHALLAVGNAALKPAERDAWATYNFEVRGTHTYVAEGICVHNRCDSWTVNA